MKYTVRIIWEGEMIAKPFETDSEILAWARYNSTVSDYRRYDSEMVEGVSIQIIAGDEILESVHFEHGQEW